MNGGGIEDGGRTVNDLIEAAGSGARGVSIAELARVLRHVASAGFDPDAREAVRGKIVGLDRPGGGQVQRGDRLPPDEVHYLRHVVYQREWPPGTSLADYVASVRRAIEDAASGVFVSRYAGSWQLGVIGHSRGVRGPNGGRWILIDYRVETGHWVTAYQPNRPLKPAVYGRDREGVRWLRLPRRQPSASDTPSG